MNLSLPAHFGKPADFVVRQAEPFNAGPPLEQLARTPVTPTELFFVRNHGAVPAVDPAAYRLAVAGLGLRPLTLTLADLQERFPMVSVPATLQCAGNRRDELAAVQPIPDELGWGAEAVSHAVWTGARLRDVLQAAGLDVAAAPYWHLEMVGLDETERLGRRINFGGSIPLAKALGAEVLLAYAMNGRPLTPVHGAPVRAVVPGYIGARSVKWLTALTLREQPSDNYFQARAYRLFPPRVTAATVDWDAGLRLGETSITSVICLPAAGASLPAGEVLARGYAMAGGGRQVARVDVSADGGATWREAELLGAPEPWSWRLWQARVQLTPGWSTLVTRAVDTAGNSQPPDAAQVWNFKGYMNNAWHRVSVAVKP